MSCPSLVTGSSILENFEARVEFRDVRVELRETGRQNDFRAINFLFYSLSSSILECFKLRVETVETYS